MTVGFPSGLMVKKDYTSYGDLRETTEKRVYLRIMQAAEGVRIG